MKTQLSIMALLALGMGACNSDTTTTSTTDTAVVAPTTDPNMVTTTTTTTTTRPIYQPKPEIKYIDLRTKEKITVRVDTVHHYIINTVTNQPVDFIVEPGTTDTIYGRNMVIANGLINYGTGSDWRFDESLANVNPASSDMSTSNPNTDTAVVAPGKEIRKVKTNGNETKVKYKDGSKMKTTDDETKIKNK